MASDAGRWPLRARGTRTRGTAHASSCRQCWRRRPRGSRRACGSFPAHWQCSAAGCVRLHVVCGARAAGGGRRSAHLEAGLHALGLDGLDGGVGERAREMGVDGKALPVPAAANDAPGRADDGAEEDVDALSPKLGAHGGAAHGGKLLVPAGPDVSRSVAGARPPTGHGPRTDVYAAGVGIDEIGKAEAVACVAEAHAGKAQALNGGDGAGAAGGQVDAAGEANLGAMSHDGPGLSSSRGRAPFLAWSSGRRDAWPCYRRRPTPSQPSRLREGASG